MQRMFCMYSIHHSFTLSVQAQNLPFQQIFPTVDFFYLPDCLTITGLDRIYHAHYFIFVSHFNFLFIPCGRLSWLPVSFLLHVKYTLSYRIVLNRVPSLIIITIIIIIGTFIERHICLQKATEAGYISVRQSGDSY